MNTRLVNSAAGVILAALQQHRTAAGIALALDSAQLLLTPAVTDELKQLQERVAELEEKSSRALPWAAAMPDDDLHLFLDDLVSATIDRWRSDPEVPDREVLANVEKVCAAWRTSGQGYRSDEPEEKCSREPAADATPGEAYAGELVMLRGLVATLRAVAEHGDLNEVRQLLDEHKRDEQDAYTDLPTADAEQAGQLAEWCTGCNTDHDPDRCGYRPGAGGAE